MPICIDLETDTAMVEELSDLPLVWQELPDHSLPGIWPGKGSDRHWP